MTLPLESKEPLMAVEFHRILATARIFAGKDDTLPMLTCVKLQATGTHLIAVATDRFNLAAAACKYDGEPFEVMLTPEALDVILTAVNPGRGYARTLRTVSLRSTPAGRFFYVAVKGGRDEGVNLVVRPSKAEFPAWRQLIPEKMPEENTVAVIGLDPVRLAKFGQARRLNKNASPQFFFTSPSRPVVCRMGDDFIGLLMPIRLPGDDKASGKLRPDWMG